MHESVKQELHVSKSNVLQSNKELESLRKRIHERDVEASKREDALQARNKELQK